MNLSIKYKLNEVLRHGLIYGLTSSLQSLLGFALLPILTSFYTIEEFGVYSILLVMGTFASAIFYFGASSALGRFYYEEDTLIFKKSIISSAFQITAFGAFLLIILATLFSANLSILAFKTETYKSAIQLTFYGVALTFLLNLFTLILRYNNKSSVYLLVTVFSVLINFTVTYILLSYFNYGIKSPLIGLIFSNLFTFLILLFYIKSYLSFRFNKSYLKKLLSFGIPALLTSLLFYFLDLADRFIIKDLVSISEVGIYSFGYKIASVINILIIAPFGLIWAPFRMKNSKNEEVTKILIVKVTSYIIIIGIIMMTISILFGKSLLLVFVKKQDFLEAFEIIPILIAGIFLFGLQNILDYGINFYKKLQYYIFTAIFGIVFNISSNYLLIPIFGYKAAAYVTMFTYLLTTCLIFIFSSKFFKVKLEWTRIIYPIFFVIFLMFVFIFYPKSFDNFILSIILFFTMVFTLYRYWLNKSERNYLNDFLKGFI